MGKQSLKENKIFKAAIIKAIPIMCSYFFVSMAYGMMMQKAGFAWYYSLFTSLTVYTGAFQFVLITFLSSGASYLTIAVTALLMNSRQLFYSVTFVEDFKRMGRRMPYMIHTMTDETYAVNCTIKEQGKERYDMMFFVALIARISWMIGAVVGGAIGQLIFAESAFMLPALIIVSEILILTGAGGGNGKEKNISEGSTSGEEHENDIVKAGGRSGR